MTANLRIDIDRLMARLFRLGEIGALPGGGVKRLALSEEDRQARALLVEWMERLGLDIAVDRIGNIWATRAGGESGAPVVVGSHIDTVATGGLYDGALGVLAGLEVVETLNEAGIGTRRPIAVAAFTNEEGARFAPDMMGSGVQAGQLELDDMLGVVGIDGVRVSDELDRIGYAGEVPPRTLRPACFLEFHVEQGPVLERTGTTIGAVTGVQGISWTELTIDGVSNHAGTTPMALRRDAGLVAARIGAFVRELAVELGPPQVATVGALELSPGLVNVVPERARMTVDLRNIEEEVLQRAEARLDDAARQFAEAEGCTLIPRRLARFEPVMFDRALVERLIGIAEQLGLSVRRMPSGAGHDAQMFAPICPTAMIFVPSQDGLSHNVREYTAPHDIEAGANVLLHMVLSVADAPAGGAAWA